MCRGSCPDAPSPLATHRSTWIADVCHCSGCLLPCQALQLIHVAVQAPHVFQICLFSARQLAKLQAAAAAVSDIGERGGGGELQHLSRASSGCEARCKELLHDGVHTCGTLQMTLKSVGRRGTNSINHAVCHCRRRRHRQCALLRPRCSCREQGCLQSEIRESNSKKAFRREQGPAARRSAEMSCDVTQARTTQMKLTTATMS